MTTTTCRLELKILQFKNQRSISTELLKNPKIIEVYIEGITYI